jgi:hypothetical protein
MRKLFWAFLAASFLLVSLYSAADTISPPLVPNPQLIPGDVLSTDVAAICTPGCSTSTILAGQRQLFWPVGLEPS